MFKIPNLIKFFTPIQRLRTSSFNFSSASTQTLPLRLNLHYSEKLIKQIFLSSSTTLSEFETQLKNNDPKIHHISFFNEENKELTTKNLNLVDLFVNEGLKFKINDKFHSFEIKDLDYYYNSKFDNLLKENEIQNPESLPLINFLDKFNEQKEKNHVNKSSFTKKDVLNLLNNSLKLYSTSTQVKNQILNDKAQKINSQLIDFEKKTAEIESILKIQSQQPLKILIYLTIIQWMVLFYICYYLYGWDFTEPIGYLISLGIEIVGINYFLKNSTELGQKTIFSNKFNNSKNSFFSKITTNHSVDKKMLVRRLNLLKKRIIFGKLGL